MSVGPVSVGPVLVTQLLVGFAVTLASGCGEPESIQSYTVSRSIEEENNRVLAETRRKAQAAMPPMVAAAKPVPGRLLGALLPAGDKTWVFKLLGDRDAVSKHVDEVKQFVAGANVKGPAPQWKLPATWREKNPPGPMRYATFVLGDSEPALELAVSELPGVQSIADNVNRWRSQVGLPAMSSEEAEASAVEVATAAGSARWVDLSGNYSPSAGMPPFAGGAAAAQGGAGATLPADHPPLPQITPGANRPSPPAADLPVAFDVPAGWLPGPATQFSVASFQIADGEKLATVTVSSAAGGLLDNVNRWRGQLQLPPIDEAALESSATKMKVDGRDTTTVEIIGPARPEGQRAIYGAIVVESPNQSWFIKMTGDASVAFREREKFLRFVQTLKFK